MEQLRLFKWLFTALLLSFLAVFAASCDENSGDEFPEFLNMVSPAND